MSTPKELLVLFAKDAPNYVTALTFTTFALYKSGRSLRGGYKLIGDGLLYPAYVLRPMVLLELFTALCFMSGDNVLGCCCSGAMLGALAHVHIVNAVTPNLPVPTLSSISWSPSAPVTATQLRTSNPAPIPAEPSVACCVAASRRLDGGTCGHSLLCAS